jgi:hypothetical protein
MMRAMVSPYLRSVLLVGLVAAASGAACRRDGCVGGDDGRCLPAAACAELHYSCDGLAGTLRLVSLQADGGGVPGWKTDPKTLAAPGDFVLENDRVRVVLDAPEHPHHLAPSGGSIIDFSPMVPRNVAGDQTNAIYQAAGLLPRDAVHYERAETYDDPGAGFVAVVFRGRLEADRRVSVVTRYELRRCEPGLRVRTDLYNGAPDPNTLYLTDAFFWGDQTLVPFVPGTGLGFRAPELDLEHVDEAWREWPFMAARAQAPPDTSYAAVPCDRDRGAGFNSTTLTAAGVPLRTTQPGDGVRFERFLIATQGPGLAPAVGEALRVRAMVHGEPSPVAARGRIVTDAGVPIKSEAGRAASLLFYEPAFGPDPDEPSRRTPWTEAVPNVDGRFEVSLPPDRSYRIQAYGFGRPIGAPTTFSVARADVDLGDISVVAPATLIVDVESKAGTPATFAQLVVVPSEPSSVTPAPTFYGLFPGCEPMLGPPHGGTPACNRALTESGQFVLLVPPGRYNVYATRGPFARLNRAAVDLVSGEEEHLSLLSESLDKLLPADVLSGDFHVHGAGSFDSSIPDQDRVVSFLAAGVDVVVATDHDVVTTYASTLAALGAGDRMVVIPGVEQTPNILWFDVPGETFPRTLGHFNFWPLATGGMPRIAAPWDELREPGELMDDIEPFFDPPGSGIRQLNHPYSETKLGRDQGFLRAINYDPRRSIEKNDTFAAQVLNRRPRGEHRNLDWDVQEVMTGASRADWLRYRALWFSLLSQGILRTGTANSDTHSLALEQVGYPRNLVFGEHLTVNPFSVEQFNGAVRAGRVVGTNGPVLNAWIEDEIDDGTGNLVKQVFRPNVDPRQAIKQTSTMTLNIVVSGAPWIPIEEVRVIVNGDVVQTRTQEVTDLGPSNHFGTQPWRISIPPISVSHLMPVTANPDQRPDTWIVVEAGMTLPSRMDLEDVDGDGLPDLAPGAVPPSSLADLQVVAPGVWPVAFSNPFLIDRDGDGWNAPGLP